MSDQFRWEGLVLRGPLSLLANSQESVILPRGPPGSGALSTGQWSLSLTKKKQKWDLCWTWTAETKRTNELLFVWNLVNPANPDKPETFRYGTELGDALADSDLFSFTDTVQGVAALNKHIAAGSEFEATTVNFELLASSDNARLAAQGSATIDPLTATFNHLTSPQLDINFAFSDSNQPLHSNSDLLKAKSAVFNRLLSIPLIKKESASINGSGQAAIKLELVSVIQSPPWLKLCTINVTNSNFDAIAAVLMWIHTGYINFGVPPAAVNQDGPPPAKRARTDPATRPAARPADSGPLPALSWQDAYRAADALEIAGLKDAALVELARTLTVETAAAELFGPLSAAHADVRGVAMDYVVGHTAVMESAGMREAEERVKRGEVEKGTEIVIELARAMARR